MSGGRLINYFHTTFGPNGSPAYKEAQECFARSLAGLSLLTYILGIKNRHDGNILLDEKGHIFASDFSCSLGKSSVMEVAPFKLTKEYMTILGGQESPAYSRFCDLFVAGFKIANEDAATAIALATLLSGDCFDPKVKQASKCTKHLRDRLMLNTSSERVVEKARSLIEKSQRSMLTSAYDVISRSKGIAGVEV